MEKRGVFGAVGLAMALIIALAVAGCSGDKGGSAGVAGVRVTCLDLTDTGVCSQTPVEDQAAAASFFNFFVPNAYAADLTVTTSFELGDVYAGTQLLWIATIQNTSPDTAFSGILYRKISDISGQSAEVFIPAGGTFEILLDAGPALIPGPGAASFGVWAWDANFTLEEWQYKDYYKLDDWTQTVLPSAIATATYNIIDIPL